MKILIHDSSVLEEEEERGVAHIVEHLAFSATKKYTNHDIVKFLESIGAEFGACQNAVTSSDETVYELFVPIDKPELLSQAISVLAEFSSEVRTNIHDIHLHHPSSSFPYFLCVQIRVSAEDLEKERGAVMEEYRANRNANGRMQDAHWLLMMEGSKVCICHKYFFLFFIVSKIFLSKISIIFIPVCRAFTNWIREGDPDSFS